MKKIIFGIFRVALSFGVLLYVLRTISFQEIVTNMASANVWFIFIGTCILQINIYIAALKLNVLTKKQKMLLTVGNIFKINYITKFYDLIFPQLISGGVIRWHILSKNDKKPAQALAAMIFNRLTEVQILVVFGLFFWFLDNPPNSNSFTGFSLIFFTLVLFSVYPIVLNKKLYDFISINLHKIPFFPKIFIEKLNKVFISIGHYKNLTRTELVYVFGLSFAKHLVGLLSIYMISLSIDLNVSFISLGWIRTILQIICALPISVNGVGFREGSLIYMLGLYSVAPALSVTLSFLLYIVNFFGGFIGGIYLVFDQISQIHSKFFPSKGIRDGSK